MRAYLSHGTDGGEEAPCCNAAPRLKGIAKSTPAAVHRARCTIEVQFNNNSPPPLKLPGR